MKNIVVVDIDGTISEPGERVKFADSNPPDWVLFYEDDFKDDPIPEVLQLVKNLSHVYKIVFCTSRSERVREKTRDWLAMNDFIIDDEFLIMRPDDDERHCIDMKPDLLKKAGIDFSQIAFILEDKNSMVKQWRDLGLICLQVREGDF